MSTTVLFYGPFNPGLADMGCGILVFYKVDSLAVDKDIALNSQMLLDDRM